MFTQSSPAGAASISLVDYDPDGSPPFDGLLNGGFENPDDQVGTVNFNNTDFWIDMGGDDTANARRDNISRTGVFSAQLAWNIQPMLDTYAGPDNYTISVGDTYDLSFWYRSAFNWDAADLITWQLFYTDNDTRSGAKTVLFSATLSGFPATFSEESLTTAAVSDGGAGGRHLWLGFAISADVNEFARLDDVQLSVNTIPEPSTLTLAALGLLGLGFYGWRRRYASPRP